MLSQTDAIFRPQLATATAVRGGLAFLNSQDEVYLLDDEESDEPDDPSEAILDALEQEIHQVVQTYRSEVSETFDKLRLEMKYKMQGAEDYDRESLDLPTFEKSKNALEDNTKSLSQELKKVLKDANRWDRMSRPYERLAQSVLRKSGYSFQRLQRFAQGNYKMYALVAFALSYLVTRLIQEWVVARAVTVAPTPPPKYSIAWLCQVLHTVQHFLLRVLFGCRYNK